MNKLLTGLQAILNAVSIPEIESILLDLKRKPGKTLAKMKHEESNKKGFKLFLVIMAFLAICTITYFAFIGGAYINDYAGPIAILFGVLDLSVVFLLYVDAVKGKLRYGLLAFEILSLLYLGYAMSGYFGGGNLRTTAEKKISNCYTIAKEHYTNAQGTADLMLRVTKNATNVADVESKRDGKGVVFEKAQFISQMKAEELQPVGDLPNVPNFDNLTEANKWLQKERQKVGDMIGKYEAGNKAMIDQAKSTEASLAQALTSAGLSPEQISNVQVLKSSVHEIATKENSTSKLTDEILKPSDLKADGFQNIIGYIIDGIAIFFIFVLVIQKTKTDEETLKSIQEEEAKLLMNEIVIEEGLLYDPALVNSKIPLVKQCEILNTVLNNEDLLKYLRNKVGFDEYANFYVDHSQIARILSNSKWNLKDIKDQIAKNSSFANYAEHALLLSPTDWKSLQTMIPDLDQFFELEDDDRAKFLTALKKAQIKGTKADELKLFAQKFLLETERGENFFPVLDVCVNTITDPVLLRELTFQFVQNANERTAKFVCEIVTHATQFKKIMSSWTEQQNDALNRILLSTLVEDASFTRFMQCVFNNGGVDGFKKLVSTYDARMAETQNNPVGNKTVILNPDFNAIQTALTAGNDKEFLSLVEEAFKVQSTAVA